MKSKMVHTGRERGRGGFVKETPGTEGDLGWDCVGYKHNDKWPLHSEKINWNWTISGHILITCGQRSNITALACLTCSVGPWRSYGRKCTAVIILAAVTQLENPKNGQRGVHGDQIQWEVNSMLTERKASDRGPVEPKARCTADDRTARGRAYCSFGEGTAKSRAQCTERRADRTASHTCCARSNSHTVSRRGGNYECRAHGTCGSKSGVDRSWNDTADGTAPENTGHSYHDRRGRI
ncbi:hypothetical protein EYF80_011112 [Liparis tanakae]|uniref:Uncharacterized protein n=1 Tax=Liparis tanakae TaxID=230148 RepID=A0A4Z2ILV3_9TELE|nr:hypothetical protein EYF80_011112 [Liparis tanakae]